MTLPNQCVTPRILEAKVDLWWQPPTSTYQPLKQNYSML